jgi:hypothetical protein
LQPGVDPVADLVETPRVTARSHAPIRARGQSRSSSSVSGSTASSSVRSRRTFST